MASNVPVRDRVGPYRLLRRLGAGGMGETYEARAPGGETVCLKTLRPELAGDPRYLDMFREEARIHSTLVHPNIVRVLDASKSVGEPYLVLEMVDGVGLDVLLSFLSTRAEHGDPAVSAHILLGLAEALDAAHSFALDGRVQHLVHRDVSPSNVLLSRTGEVKLSDFGIAKTRAGMAHTTAGVVRGKYAYMSPEQTRGEPLDRRSDLFALGVIAYELFAGVHPFRLGRDENEVMAAHRMLLGERATLAQRAPWLPVGIRDAIEHLLVPEVSLRPLEARTLVTALRAFAPTRDGKAALQRLLARALAWTHGTGPGVHATEAIPQAGPTRDVGSAPRQAEPLVRAGTGRALADYLAQLPSGLDSFAHCRAKGSLVREFLSARPLDPEGNYPEPLREMIARPPVSSSWIPEVMFLSMALAVRDAHFRDDESFLAAVKELNARMFRGQVYRTLMLVSSTRLLAHGAALRWRQFHTGTTVTARHGSDSSMDVTFACPTGLFTPLHLRLFASAIEAAVEAAGAARARTEYTRFKPQGAEVRLVW